MSENLSHQISHWVSFLRNYGPISQNENTFDERIAASLKRWQIAPIEVKLEYLDELVENFESTSPRSVILTGTAGDGKTFYCRQVWQKLQSDGPGWDTELELQALPLAKGLTLEVIKDLSAIVGEEKKTTLKRIADVLTGRLTDRVFLIAANDGQLMEGWSQLEEYEYVHAVKNNIEKLLVEGSCRISQSSEYNYDLYNLSRTSAEKRFIEVLEVVLDHSGWTQCDICKFQKGSVQRPPCPIWENKTRLSNKLMQQRISDLLELSELNGFHLPIRQLLILVANVILGHTAVKDRLMTCKDVMQVLAEGTIAQANPYQNVFGENLTKRRRESIEVFRVLQRFGIGNETNNFIDGILIFGADDPELDTHYKDLVMSDLYYGGDSTYRKGQSSYLEGGEGADNSAFLAQLVGQRQRLFFTIPEVNATEMRLWQLTTFHFADEYLNKVHRELMLNKSVHLEIVARLVRGLNRIFTGMLVHDDDRIILATSGNLSQARISRVFEEFISVRRNRGQRVQLELFYEAPALTVYLSSAHWARLPLNLRRYEYLARIAEGALPNSFSRECYEDIMAYKTDLLRKLDERRREEQHEDDEKDQLTLSLITRLNPDGSISNPDNIEIRM